MIHIRLFQVNNLIRAVQAGHSYATTGPWYIRTGHSLGEALTVQSGDKVHLTFEALAAQSLSQADLVLEDPSSVQSRVDNADQLREQLKTFFKPTPPSHPDKDQWVTAYFSGQNSVTGIVESLRQCNLHQELCQDVFSSLAERSPTSLVLTLTLLRRNASLPLPQVFQNDLKAGQFIMSHPDFLEGVRSRLIDKDKYLLLLILDF